MIIEEDDGFQQVTLENGRKYGVSGLELPEYGTDSEGNSHIFTQAEREEIAACMIKKWAEYCKSEARDA